MARSRPLQGGHLLRSLPTPCRSARGRAVQPAKRCRLPPPCPRSGHLPANKVSSGTACRSVTHDRTVARLSIAWTRQVTVTKLICGVDVSATTLEARVGRDGPVERFARNVAGIAALAAFCKQHQVALVAMEATGGYEKLPFGLLWAA